MLFRSRVDKVNKTEDVIHKAVEAKKTDKVSMTEDVSKVQVQDEVICQTGEEISIMIQDLSYHWLSSSACSSVPKRSEGEAVFVQAGGQELQFVAASEMVEVPDHLMANCNFSHDHHLRYVPNLEVQKTWNQDKEGVPDHSMANPVQGQDLQHGAVPLLESQESWRSQEFSPVSHSLDMLFKSEHELLVQVDHVKAEKLMATTQANEKFESQSCQKFNLAMQAVYELSLFVPTGEKTGQGWMAMPKMRITTSQLCQPDVWKNCQLKTGILGESVTNWQEKEEAVKATLFSVCASDAYGSIKDSNKKPHLYQKLYGVSFLDTGQ